MRPPETSPSPKRDSPTVQTEGGAPGSSSCSRADSATTPRANSCTRPTQGSRCYGPRAHRWATAPMNWRLLGRGDHLAIGEPPGKPAQVGVTQGSVGTVGETVLTEEPFCVGGEVAAILREHAPHRRGSSPRAAQAARRSAGRGPVPRDGRGCRTSCARSVRSSAVPCSSATWVVATP
jgi:hypothetical protein